MPPVTQTLLIANVAVFLLQSASGGQLEAWFALWPPGYGFWMWQLVTYGFLHGGIGHIFFNMLGLYMFGSDIERLFGSRYFLAYYFACLVAAALSQLVFTAIAGGPPVPTLGASGALYGLLLAFGMYFPRRMVMLIFPPIPMQARFFVILFGALELVFGVTGTAAGVAHFAHLGGMLGGWLAIQYRRRGFPFTRGR
ncbi:MAG TPA: rhomboid family intramembrane serine protease [Burkholderiales bacterium]|jgi:membrane associated rhomboid family serine protease|nr:rhomboid family intramembrane serine protease [Burkholderiales bacterium]